jgi:hypothetical protein
VTVYVYVKSSRSVILAERKSSLCRQQESIIERMKNLICQVATAGIFLADLVKCFDVNLVFIIEIFRSYHGKKLNIEPYLNYILRCPFRISSGSPIIVAEVFLGSRAPCRRISGGFLQQEGTTASFLRIFYLIAGLVSF